MIEVGMDFTISGEVVQEGVHGEFDMLSPKYKFVFYCEIFLLKKRIRILWRKCKRRLAITLRIIMRSWIEGI